jgi:hypothetical protein
MFLLFLSHMAWKHFKTNPLAFFSSFCSQNIKKFTKFSYDINFFTHNFKTHFTDFLRG